MNARSTDRRREERRLDGFLAWLATVEVGSRLVDASTVTTTAYDPDRQGGPRVTLHLTTHQLRDLAPAADALTAAAGATLGEAGAVLADLAYAVRAAADADPECPTCWGTGSWHTPSGDDGVAEHRCPACRPWPNGFPGASQTQFVGGRRVKVWTIAPYGPGENVATMRRVFAP